jgi:predicted amidohydrolase YtcJ
MSRDRHASTVFVNGSVLTMDGPAVGERPTAIVVSDGRIRYVGDDASARAQLSGDAELVDLGGKTVLPGLIESHAHPSLYGRNLLEVDCRPTIADSVAAVQAEIAAAVAVVEPGEWVLGWGWDETHFPEGRAPLRVELDRVAPDNPVLLRRVCGHMSVVNSAALRASGVPDDVTDPPGGHVGRDSDGGLTGLLQEKAQGLVVPPPYSVDDVVRGFRLAQAKFASWGVTTVHDMSSRGQDMQVYQRMHAAGELDLRVRPWLWAVQANGWEGVLSEALTLGVASGLGDDVVRLQGVKFMLDGSVGGRTAAVAEPFQDSCDTGILTMSLEETAPWVTAALDGGLRVAIHGIGERAIDVAIDSVQRAAAELGVERVTAMRNRIEHCALPTEQNLLDMKRLGLVAASSVGFLYTLGDSYLANLGPERVKRAYPHRSFREHGIVAPGNSDSPVTEGNPWLGIYGAVTRTTRSGQVLDTTQNISLEEALRAYTRDAAYSSFEEHHLGVIRPGALADLNVLAEDPFAVGSEDLHGMQTAATYVAGRQVHSA